MNDIDNMPIKPADRILRLPPYLFARINAVKHALRQKNEDVIDLGMGNPVDRPPQVVIDKLCEAAQEAKNNRYSASSGIFNLRREITKVYQSRFGVELDPNSEVIACLGSKEGFSHICLALMGPGDTAVVGDPAFPIHNYAIALAGGNVISVPLGNDERFLSRIAYVLDHLYPRPKLIILNYPHNPTTLTVEPAFFEEVVKVAKKYQVAVIHDFAYGLTCFDDYKAPSFLSAKGAKDVGVEFITMSKGYNMAGWRIGFCVGNRGMVKALATIKGYYDYGIFQAVQIASIIALRNCEQEMIQQAKIYQKRRDCLVAGLTKIGWEVESPRATMFVWAKVAPQHLAGQGTIDFSLRLLEGAKVVVSPGRAFGENGEGYVRIALVENEKRLKQAMRQIEVFVGAKQVKRSRPTKHSSTKINPAEIEI
ncbi:MAG: aminotransferase class I/II-fold pyridoxal phosphate-dependent enzyme [Phycisphaerae bacterium]